MDTVTVRVTKAEWLNSGPRSSPKHRAFIAYRFVEESEHFKQALSRGLAEAWDVEVLSGSSIGGGEDWSGGIRKLIDKSKMIVADVTNTSREVMFEIGYAGNKPALYVTSNSEARSALPRWVTIRQGLTYEGAGLQSITQAVGGYFAENSFPKMPRRATAPGLAVVVQGKDQTWANGIIDRLRVQLGEAGVVLRPCDPAQLANAQDLADFASAHLLFACIDGSADDYLSHFLLGDVAGRPKLGSTTRVANASLTRLGVALTPTRASFDTNTADSLRRVSNSYLANASDFDSLKALVSPRLARYKDFRREKAGDMP